MEFRLETAGSRRALLVASLGVAAILIAQAVVFWLASDGIDSPRAESVERGAALVPGNGEGWDRLGRFRQWDFADPSPSVAVGYYQRAVQDDPRSAHYWLDLAGAYEDVGDLANAQKAFDRARAVYPLSAEVTWNYGNFLLREGDSSRAYKEIQRAVEADPSLLPLAISRTWRATGDVDQLLNEALPPDSQAYLQALDFFISIQRADLCLVVWQRVVDLGKPLELSRAFPFIDALMAQDRAEDARRVWGQALAASGSSQPTPSGPSLIWDGDFSTDFTNGGLGWRWGSPPGVSINFDAPPSSGGKRSVRLDFGGGTNVALDTPGQFVPVEPGRAYHFHANIRAEKLSTESGIRLSLSDPSHSDSVSVLTGNLTGTRPWMPLDADFTTGPSTHILAVRLFRSPSRLFENKLSGTVWIANLSLSPSDLKTGKASP